MRYVLFDRRGDSTTGDLAALAVAAGLQVIDSVSGRAVLVEAPPERIAQLRKERPEIVIAEETIHPSPRIRSHR